MTPVPSWADWLPTLAALLHFMQLPSMALARRTLGWDREFLELTPINQRIIQVIGGGILLCVLGLGVLVLSAHGSLLDSTLGMSVCLFSSVFWAYRGAVQLFIYGEIWPISARRAHHALCVLFALLTAAYALSAGLAWTFAAQQARVGAPTLDKHAWVGPP